MSKELPSCSGCEHEYECVNLVCFYELLEKEKQKIRADAIDETLEDLRKWLWKNDKCAYHYLNDYYIKPKREQLKEQ